MATAFAGRRLEYVDYHHLTEIPASIRNWKHKNVSIKTIEDNLHQKLAQRCTSDKQLYVEILRLFKEQCQRSGKDPDAVVGINKTDFSQLLTILGLHATQEQADEIFDKYDTNHSNNLSIHEFWVQCRPSDYRTLPGFNEKQVKDEMIMNRARKRMFIRESLLHVPVNTEVPGSTVYALPLDRLLVGLRDKIRQRSSVDCTLSAQRTRHQLAKLFEDFDERQTGVVTEQSLKKVLNKINFFCW
jgi:Ca2+-binding EF-hand superfamily protein